MEAFRLQGMVGCREEQVLGGIFGVVHLDWGISMQRDSP